VRVRDACAAVAFVVVAAVVVIAAEARGSSIEQVSWLAGCWQSAGEGPRIDEQWMAPAGGLMLGMARTVKGGRATQFEQMRIGEQEGKLVFTSKPSGQEEGSFTAIEVTSSRVVFENTTHDFPQRIIYKRVDEGTLEARIEGEEAGKIKGFDFPMRRASCGG